MAPGAAGGCALSSLDPRSRRFTPSQGGEEGPGARGSAVPTFFPPGPPLSLKPSLWGFKLSAFPTSTKPPPSRWSRAAPAWSAMSPAIFQALLGLQASELFQQVAGPPKCPPAPEEQAPRGRGRIGMRARRVWFQCRLPWWNTLLFFNNWPALDPTELRCCRFSQFPIRSSRGHSVKSGGALRGRHPGPVVSARRLCTWRVFINGRILPGEGGLGMEGFWRVEVKGDGRPPAPCSTWEAWDEGLPWGSLSRKARPPWFLQHSGPGLTFPAQDHLYVPPARSSWAPPRPQKGT